jgi:hypothetical protein
MNLRGAAMEPSGSARCSTTVIHMPGSARSLCVRILDPFLQPVARQLQHPVDIVGVVVHVE